MYDLHEIVNYCDQRLNIDRIKDYCPNGLQVEACSQVSKIVTAVTASMDAIDVAADAGADVLLVHHGYFWKGEQQQLVGMKGRRIRRLYETEISLLAYHLPLDMHEDLGNNRQLGLKLGFDEGAPLDETDPLIWGVELEEPLAVEELQKRVEVALGRKPLTIQSEQSMRKIAWCTGGAQSYIDKVAGMGFDAYISGEISEPTVHSAREMGITYVSAGHHATERYGVQALGAELMRKFNIQHEFIDIDNPV